ncbi:MAG: FG-GAP repeat protein [Magnetococcales bacterium]|nr:FG-GAP repeat protein [Magnetococcales bacterium]
MSSPFYPEGRSVLQGGAALALPLDLDLGAEAFHIPNTLLLLQSTLFRAGDHLLLLGVDGTRYTVEGYFATERPAPLYTADGRVLLPETVRLLLQGGSVDDPQGGTLVAGPGGVSDPGVPIGQVQEMVGEVTARNRAGVTRTLAKGDAIYQEDLIKTAAGGQAKLLFLDQTQLQLGAATQLILNQYLYNPSAGEGHFEATVTRGLFKYTSGDLARQHAGRHTLLKTPTAQIGVRGSEVQVDVGEDGQTTVLHNAGVLEIANAQGQGVVTLLEPGMATVVTLDSMPRQPFMAPSTLLNHFSNQLPPVITERKTEGSQGEERGKESAVPDAKPVVPDKGRGGAAEEANKGKPAATPDGKTAPAEGGEANIVGPGAPDQLPGGDGAHPLLSEQYALLPKIGEGLLNLFSPNPQGNHSPGVLSPLTPGGLPPLLLDLSSPGPAPFSTLLSGNHPPLTLPPVTQPPVTQAPSQSTVLGWARQHGGDPDDFNHGSWGGDLVLDAAGNIYMVGGFYGTIATPVWLTASTGEQSAFMQKWSNAGVAAWVTALLPDSSGGVDDLRIRLVSETVAGVTSSYLYFSGEFWGTLEVAPGSTLTSAGGSDLMVGKWDLSGHLLWVKQFGGSGDDGGVLIGNSAAGVQVGWGSVQSGMAVSGTDLHAITLATANGVVLQQTTLSLDSPPPSGSEPPDALQTVTADSAGNVILVGEHYSSSAGRMVPFIERITPTGSHWYQSYDGLVSAGALTGDYATAAVAVDAAGKIYISGAVGQDSLFIACVGSAGTPLWSQHYAVGQLGDWSAMTMDSSGKIYLLASYSGTATLGTYSFTSQQGSTDLLIVKLDNSGLPLWVRTLGGVGEEHVGNIAVDAAGNVYVTGGVTGQVDMDPGAGQLLQGDATGTHAFLLKLDANGLLDHLPTGAVAMTLQNGQWTASQVLQDADGPATLVVSYQWQLSADGGESWSDIAGAVAASFSPTLSELGKMVRVVCAYTDQLGIIEQMAGPAVTVDTVTTSPASLSLAAPDGEMVVRLAGATTTESAGRALCSIGDFNGDGFDDLLIGAYQADQYGTDSGSCYVVFGDAEVFTPQSDLASLTGGDGFRIDGVAAFDVAGKAVSAAGDVNGNGLADLIIGAPGVANGTGAAYVLFGRQDSVGSVLSLDTLDGTDGFRVETTEPSGLLGSTVSAAGDINGDGLDDLLVGTWLAAPSGTVLAGPAYLIFGQKTPFSSVLAVSDLDGSNGFRLDGRGTQSNSGMSIAALGDFNGDGFSDLIIGAADADPTGQLYAGAAYVVYGHAGGYASALNLAQLDGYDGFRLTGTVSGKTMVVDGAGDLNGDGLADLVVGVYTADQLAGVRTGYAYVVFGQHSAGTPQSVLDVNSLDGVSGFRVEGESLRGIQLGLSVSAAGDVNGDGYDDLLLGMPWGQSSIDQTGRCYVIFGHANGFNSVIQLSNLAVSDGFRLDGPLPFSATGVAVR